MVRVEIPDDKYIKTIKLKIYPTEEQAEIIDRYIDLSRYVYNWALEQELEHEMLYLMDLAEKRCLSREDIERRFTKLRSSKDHEFLKSIPHISARMAIWDLARGLDMYYRGINKHPRFKSKKDQKTRSYTTRFDTMYFEGSKLRIEGLPRGDKIETKWDSGWTKQTSPKFYKPVISKRRDGTYWITFGIMVDKPLDYFEKNNIPELGQAIGIDLNVKKRIQLSTGKTFYGPDLSKPRKALARIQRKIAKDRKRFKRQERTNPTITKSNRILKREQRYRVLSRRIANIEENFIQTSTKQIIKMRPSMIVMEDLNVENMHKNKFVSKLVFTPHSNFGRIRFVMEQKCFMYGIPFKLAPRRYPSSQLCSRCGNRRKIGTSKTYRCPVCGLVIDRDLNAALNLENLAYIDWYDDRMVA